MSKEKMLIDGGIVDIKVTMDNIIEDIKELDKNKLELSEILRTKIDQLTYNYNDKALAIDMRRERLVDELMVMSYQVDCKETKTQRKIELISGDIVIKKANKKIDYDKKKLLDWASNNGRQDLIQQKITSDFKWSEFKKDIEIQNGEYEDCIIDTATGEMLDIDGLNIIEEQERLIIK